LIKISFPKSFHQNGLGIITGVQLHAVVYEKWSKYMYDILCTTYTSYVKKNRERELMGPVPTMTSLHNGANNSEAVMTKIAFTTAS